MGSDNSKPENEKVENKDKVENKEGGTEGAEENKEKKSMMPEMKMPDIGCCGGRNTEEETGEKSIKEVNEADGKSEDNSKNEESNKEASAKTDATKTGEGEGASGATEST